MKSRDIWLALLLLLNFSAIQFCLASQFSLTIPSYGRIIERKMVTYFYCDFETYPFKPPWDSVDLFNGGKVSQDLLAHTGEYSAKLLFTGEGIDEDVLGGDQAVKFWQFDTEDYPEPWKSKKEMYTQVWYWFPRDFRVVSWRMILQWGQKGGPMPILALRFLEDRMVLDNRNSARPEWARTEDRHKRWTIPGYTSDTIPKERWIPIQVYTKYSSGWQQLDGHVIVWIDGKKALDLNGDVCFHPEDKPTLMWGPLHYGGKNEPKGQYILIDDVVVSSEYIS